MTAKADRYVEVVEADDTNPNAITKPPRKWRIWWLARRPFVHAITKQHIDAGLWIGPRVYPSKDVAEQAASDIIGRNIKYRGGQFSSFIGAYPEGETPPE